MEDYWINSIGKTLYGKTIEKYNKKMWLVNDNKKIDTFRWSPKGATLKKGPRAAWDRAISAYPIKLNGYDYDKTFDSIRRMQGGKTRKYKGKKQKGRTKSKTKGRKKRANRLTKKRKLIK